MIRLHIAFGYLCVAFARPETVERKPEVSNCTGSDVSKFFGDWTLVHTVSKRSLNNGTAFVRIGRLSEEDFAYFGLNAENVERTPSSEGESSSDSKMPKFMPQRMRPKTTNRPKSYVQENRIDVRCALKINIHDSLWEFNALLIRKRSAYQTFAKTTQMQPHEWLVFEMKLDLVDKLLVIQYDDDRNTSSVALKPGTHDRRKLKRLLRKLMLRDRRLSFRRK